MMLEDLLSRRKDAVLKRWLQLILETYPVDTSSFLKQEKDRFNNPVGYTISQETKTLYDGLIHGTDIDKLSVSLNNIIKIRAVQDFSPSQAVIFVFLLKEAIREDLGNETEKGSLSKEFLEFESRIDKLALLAFDTYMKCREKIFEVRLNEVKGERDRAFKLLERLNGQRE